MIKLKHLRSSYKTRPPLISPLRTIKNIFRFVNTPIPVLQEYIALAGNTFSLYLSPQDKPIVTTNPHFIQHVLQKNHRNYKKSPVQVNQLAHFLGKGLLTSDGPYWLQQRRLIQPGFHRAKLAGLTDIMLKEIDLFLDGMDARIYKRDSIDMAHEMTELTFNIMAKALFSRSIENRKMNEISEYFNRIQAFMIRQIQQPYLISWFKISGEMKRHETIAALLKKNVFQIIGQRKQSTDRYDDLLDMLREARYEDTGEGMNDQQLLDECLILLMAGHDTSANALAWTWYILCQHPKVMEKIRAEIKAVYGDQKPNIEGLAKLDYLKRVIQESMRLYPPAWIMDRVSIEEDHFEGFFIPKDRVVGIYIYGVHHSSKYWPDPEKFDPSRFKKEEVKKRPPFTYLPFGAGQHKCIGSNFSLMEMQLILIRMIQRFDFELVAGQQVEMKPLITLQPKSGIWVRGKRKVGKGDLY